MDPYNFDYSSVPPPEVSGGFVLAMMAMGIAWLIFILAIYVYMAVCLMKIAGKANTSNAWFAWIPILNIILMLQVAKKPLWWIILMFVHLVNIVISIIVWMEIAKAVRKPEWLGILMIVPIANFVVPGYLAFSKMENGGVGNVEDKTVV